MKKDEIKTSQDLIEFLGNINNAEDLSTLIYKILGEIEKENILSMREIFKVLTTIHAFFLAMLYKELNFPIEDFLKEHLESVLEISKLSD